MDKYLKYFYWMYHTFAFCFAPPKILFIFSYLIDTYAVRGSSLILSGLLIHLMVCAALLRPMSFYHNDHSQTEPLVSQNSIKRKPKTGNHGMKSDHTVVKTRLASNAILDAKGNCTSFDLHPDTRRKSASLDLLSETRKHMSGNNLSLSARKGSSLDLLSESMSKSTNFELTDDTVYGLISYDRTDADSKHDKNKGHFLKQGNSTNRKQKHTTEINGSECLKGLHDKKFDEINFENIQQLPGRSYFSHTDLSGPKGEHHLHHTLPWRFLSLSNVDLLGTGTADTQSIEELFNLSEHVETEINLPFHKNLSYCLIVTSFMLAGSAYALAIIFIPALAQELGIDKQKASIFLSATGLCEMLSRIGWGYFADLDLVRKSRMTQFFFLISGAVCLLMVQFSSFAALLGFTACLGAFGGIHITFVPNMIGDAVEMRGIALAMGIYYFGLGITCAAMSPIIGKKKLRWCKHDK